MKSIIVTATMLTSLVAMAATAEAADRHKHRHYGPEIAAPVINNYGGAWGYQPNTCFTDEGYGRHAPCSGRQ